ASGQVRKSISDPWLGLDISRTRWVWLELLSKRSQQDPQMLRLIDCVWSPNCFEDGAMRKHPAGALSHEHQQVELLRSQADRFGAATDLVTLPIDREIAANDDIVSVGRRLAAPESHPQARKQLIRAKWLRHVVIGAGVERLDLLRLGSPCGQHDNRRQTTIAND